MDISLLTPGNWSEYELLDSGSGQRLERFGKYILVRPDPQIIWESHLSNEIWQKADAIFQKTGDKEGWILKNPLPEKWLMHYKDISFWVKLSPFKHTGVFPEQAVQWDFIKEKISRAEKPVSILNLFAYTGIASLVAARGGAKVTHLDASRPAIGWAKENQTASKLIDKPIRWILDDALKFVQRELKRGAAYDGIIMDPPVYGHGPEGEKWDFYEDFPKLLHICQQLLSSHPLFILVNAYAISASSLMLENLLQPLKIKLGGTVEVGELILKEKDTDRPLSTGIFGRWSKD